MKKYSNFLCVVVVFAGSSVYYRSFVLSRSKPYPQGIWNHQENLQQDGSYTTNSNTQSADLLP